MKILSTRDGLRKIVPRKLFNFVKDALYPEKIAVLEDRLNAFFLNSYNEIAAPDINQKTLLRNAEFKVYSKHGCDGLLLYIFSKVGVTNRTFVEMGIENGRECNTANLALNFGWNGLLIDADDNWVESARQYYDDKLGEKSVKVNVVKCFVDAESINPVLKSNSVTGEIDLLSIDIDSNDYWVWKSIDSINPRVVVAEYNAAYGFHSLTMKYNPDFHFQKVSKENPLYFGASLTALTKLGKERGYVLVGCDSHGHDAYFVREDVARGNFIEMTPEEAFYPNPYTLSAIGDLETQFNLIKHLDLEEI